MNSSTNSYVLIIQTISNTTYGRFLPTICAFGIVGNILNLMTLRGSAQRAVSYMYLRSLAAADLMCMMFVLCFVLRTIGILPKEDFFVCWFAAHLELPLINFSITAGILIVIALTIERYVSVVFPVHFRDWNTRSRALQMITIAYVLSFLLYIPMCWERGAYLINDEFNLIDENITDLALYAVKDNKYVKDTRYYVLYKWFREFVTKVVPVMTLSYLNIHIIVAFQRVQKRKAVMVISNRKVCGNGGSQARDDRRLLVLMTVIAVLFFVCNTPAALNLLFIKDSLGTNVAYQIFRAVANLLEISNHAVNFYIFCTCSKENRKEFTRLFCSWRLTKSVLPGNNRRQNEMSTIEKSAVLGETKLLLTAETKQQNYLSKNASVVVTSSNGTTIALERPEVSTSPNTSDIYADEIFV